MDKIKHAETITNFHNSNMELVGVLQGLSQDCDKVVGEIKAMADTFLAAPPTDHGRQAFCRLASERLTQPQKMLAQISENCTEMLQLIATTSASYLALDPELREMGLRNLFLLEREVRQVKESMDRRISSIETIRDKLAQ